MGGAGYYAVSRLAVKRKMGVWIARASALAGSVVAVYFITQYAHYPGANKVETISRLTAAIGRLFPVFVTWTWMANRVAAMLEGLFFLAIGAAGWMGGCKLLTDPLRPSETNWPVARFDRVARFDKKELVPEP